MSDDPILCLPGDKSSIALVIIIFGYFSLEHVDGSTSSQVHPPKKLMVTLVSCLVACSVYVASHSELYNVHADMHTHLCHDYYVAVIL